MSHELRANINIIIILTSRVTTSNFATLDFLCSNPCLNNYLFHLFLYKKQSFLIQEVQNSLLEKIHYQGLNLLNRVSYMIWA